MSGQDGEGGTPFRPVPTGTPAGEIAAWAQLAHELRNRLTVINGCLELLSLEESGDLSPAQRSLLTPALSSARQLAGMGTRITELAGRGTTSAGSAGTAGPPGVLRLG